MRVSSQCEINVAYHEAGHTVAAFCLDLSIGRRGATVVPSKETGALGSAHVPPRLAQRPDCATSGRTKLRLERLAVVALAGDVAERKHNPRRRRGDHRDRENATGLLDYISGSQAVLEARLNLAYAEAQALLDCRWELVEAVAQALLEKKHLTRREAEEIIRSTVK
jgi:ATP-dependent Zn protease